MVERAFIALTIAVLVLVPQTGNYYLTLLIPAVILLARRGWWLAFGLLIAAPWAILAWLPGYEAVLMPMLVGLFFGWMIFRDGDRAANEQQAL
ncbi:MAG: hypothetical protein HC828_17375 [Blastochloris sp.]|nr:hypothetical protein [Blastochloris sp.]